MITVERLREVLNYNPDTGVFYWKKKISRKVVVGRVAGHRFRDSYIRVKLDGKLYTAHRLAWLYAYGEWPPEDIDHINENKADNSIANLRLAKRSGNMLNISPANRNSTSGLRGAHWNSGKKTWSSRIRVDGKSRYLGQFPDKESAHVAYLKAKKEYWTLH